MAGSTRELRGMMARGATVSLAAGVDGVDFVDVIAKPVDRPVARSEGEDPSLASRLSAADAQRRVSRLVD